MKILITGFQPFGGQRVNPAWEAVKKLPDVLGDKVLWKLEIPVTFGGAFDAVEAKAAEIDPDVILCVGQAGGRDAVTPERIAVNLQDASIPDNAGNQPVDLPVVADGANAYFTSLPVKAMAAAARALDIPCRLSCTAGTYVCNDVFTGCCTGIGTRRSGWASSMCRSCRSRAAPICPWIPSSGPCRPCWRQFEKIG